MDLTDYEMRVRAVPCTLCRAKEQSNCRDEKGGETRPHVARMRAYDEAQTVSSPPARKPRELPRFVHFEITRNESGAIVQVIALDTLGRFWTGDPPRPRFMLDGITWTPLGEARQ